MGRADGVGAHLLQQLDLVAERRPVDGGPQRAQVMVVADALEFRRTAVQKETFFGDILQRADAERRIVFVEHLAVTLDPCAGRVEDRGAGRPQLRVVYQEVLREGLAAVDITVAGRGGRVACGIEEVGDQIDTLMLRKPLDLDLQRDAGVIVVDRWRGDAGPPDRNMNPVCGDQMHVAVETRPGIPSRSLFEVFERHFDPVLTGYGHRGDIHNERVVAVGPVGDFAAVHPHTGVAHCAVEEQLVAPGCGVGNRDRRLVAALADEGQTARTASLECLLLLAVLFDGHDLQVILLVEGPVDRPVVWNPHHFPL